MVCCKEINISPLYQRTTLVVSDSDGLAECAAYGVTAALVGKEGFLPASIGNVTKTKESHVTLSVATGATRRVLAEYYINTPKNPEEMRWNEYLNKAPEEK
jgi:hypothetical protein